MLFLLSIGKYSDFIAVVWPFIFKMRASAFENKVVSQRVLREKVGNTNGQMKIIAVTVILGKRNLKKLIEWLRNSTDNSWFLFWKDWNKAPLVAFISLPQQPVHERDWVVCFPLCRPRDETPLENFSPDLFYLTRSCNCMWVLFDVFSFFLNDVLWWLHHLQPLETPGR